MLNIDVIELENPESDFKKHKLNVNGIESDDLYYYADSRLVRTSNKHLTEELIKHPIEDIGKYFQYLTLRHIYKIRDTFDINLVIITENKPEELYDFIELEIEVELEHWNKLWSIVEFADVLSSVISELNNENLEYFMSDDHVVAGFGLRIITDNRIKPIGEFFHEYKPLLETLIDKTIDKLETTKDSISVFYSFPPEIKVACKQYLLYFAQFLADMGIEATTDIKESVNKTLFTITPSNDHEALDKIREALAIYLNAPTIKDFDSQASSSNEISIMQWQSNILHLKSQLALAGALLQAKDATIESLQLSNYQYSQMVVKKNEPKEIKHKEEILDGLVAIKQYEGKGFSVNLPEIFRRLKRKITK